MLQRRDCLADVERLVENQLDAQILWQPDQLRQGLHDPVNDLNRVRPRLFHDRQIHGPVAVDPDNVALDDRRIGGPRHILQHDRHPVDHLDRDLVHLLHELDHAVGVHVVVELADLDVAGRQQEALRVDRGDDLARRDAARQHALPIQEHRDLPDRPPKAGRHEDAGHIGQLRAHAEVGQVPHLLLAQRLAADGEGADRQAGRAELDDDRGEHALGQVAQGRVGETGDLGHAGIHIVGRMKIDLDETHAGQRAGLDVLDVGGLQEELLQAQGDGAFDLGGPHALVEGGHRHHGQVDLRKDVHHHILVGHSPQDHDDQADRHHRIGILERRTDHSLMSG